MIEDLLGYSEACVSIIQIGDPEFLYRAATNIVMLIEYVEEAEGVYRMVIYIIINTGKIFRRGCTIPVLIIRACDITYDKLSNKLKPIILERKFRTPAPRTCPSMW